jgi:hypothetical protein
VNSKSQHPTGAELAQFSIKAFPGIDLGMGKDEPIARVSQAIETKYPGHLVLVQVGAFLHGYDRSAYALNMLKKYKLKLVGTTEAPHIRIGFPAGNFKQRLWSMVDEFGIPYVVALGSAAGGRTYYTSNHVNTNSMVLSAVTDDIVASVINDLRQRGEVLKAGTRQLLANPDSGDFKLKTFGKDLDDLLLGDIIKMPRDIRVTYGESVRVCMANIMRGIFAYGLTPEKPAVLREISADVDLLKHYLEQAARVKHLKFSESRVVLAVELGRLTGGLLRSAKAAS